MTKIYSQEEWHAEAKKKFGDDPRDWRFKCTSSLCGREQSYNSLEQQFEKGIASKRHGMPEKDERGVYKIYPYAECYSPDCNWVAYGLITSGIIVVYDPSKPHNINTQENCAYVFPFAESKEEN